MRERDDSRRRRPMLRFDRGTLLCRFWPIGLRPPIGLWRDAGTFGLRGPARLYARVLALLRARGVPFDDLVPASPGLPQPVATPGMGGGAAAALLAWRLCGRQGVVTVPLGEERAALTSAAIAEGGRAALIMVPDTALLDEWIGALRPLFGPAVAPWTSGARPAPVTLVTFAAARGAMDRLGRGFLLLVVDAAHRLGPLGHCGLQQSTASQRLGFSVAGTGREQMALEPLIGPVVASEVGEDGRPARVVVSLPLTDGERLAHDAAWHEFLGAFDRFSAAAPGASFSDFVHWARDDERGRPGLRAWHRARGVLAWTEAKGTAVGEILARHRGQRVLLFTADRASAYALARAHLVMPLTAEIPRRERQAALDAFVRGELQALVAPRLLDDALIESAADVGVLVSGSFGERQRVTRARRIAPTGVVYELVSRHTSEEGRGRGGIAGATPRR